MAFHDIDELLNRVKEQYNGLRRSYDLTIRRLSEFKKDEEIQAANRRANDTFRRSLKMLSNKEASAIQTFKNAHYAMHTPHTKSSGSTYIYTLTQTGVGTAISITCPVCGKTENVTDYDSL